MTPPIDAYDSLAYVQTIESRDGEDLRQSRLVSFLRRIAFGYS